MNKPKETEQNLKPKTHSFVQMLVCTFHNIIPENQNTLLYADVFPVPHLPTHFSTFLCMKTSATTQSNLWH